jgi:hypothetical protein
MEYLQFRGPMVLVGTEFEARIDEFVSVLDNVIATGYGILNAVQCSNGAFPNWVTLSSNAADLPWEGLTYACSASGTPPKQFGYEAARLPWRLALDYTLYRSVIHSDHNPNSAFAFALLFTLYLLLPWQFSTTLFTG